MPTAAVEQLLYLLDQAFDGEDWHSLLGNLHEVTPEDWPLVPHGGSRSIRDIVRHIGICKIMYENHTFGDASLDWDHPFVTGGDALADSASAIVWLRTGHARLRERVASLDDADLVTQRPTSWGELKETRWIISIIMQHDLYHAGEINHLRSLCRRDDSWEHEREP